MKMINITNKLILTAGPSISYKEVEYVTDAVVNGQNHHHSDYIKSFEETIPLDLDKGSRIQNMYNRFIEFSRFVNNDLFL